VRKRRRTTTKFCSGPFPFFTLPRGYELEHLGHKFFRAFPNFLDAEGNHVARSAHDPVARVNARHRPLRLSGAARPSAPMPRPFRHRSYGQLDALPAEQCRQHRGRDAECTDRFARGMQRAQEPAHVRITRQPGPSTANVHRFLAAAVPPGMTMPSSSSTPTPPTARTLHARMRGGLAQHVPALAGRGSREVIDHVRLILVRGDAHRLRAVFVEEIQGEGCFVNFAAVHHATAG